MPGQAARIVDQENIERARLKRSGLDQRNETRPVRTRTGLGLINVDMLVENLPTLALRKSRHFRSWS